MKNKNILLLLESHVEKIVLAISVLVSLFLLGVFVIGNPYGETVRFRGARERKLSPSEIDREIKKAVEAAVPELDKPGPGVPPVKNYLVEYDRLVESSLSGISSTVAVIPIPSEGDMVIEEDRLYTLPEIPSLAEVAVGRLRGAAKIPTEEIGPDRLYASSMSEIGDIDLVTVSARFDVQVLYNNFQQSFMGPRLKTAWKDDLLAVPVFAKMEVQRRTQQGNNNWGAWELVPRTAIDPQQKLMMDLPQVLEDVSLGVNFWKAQYDIQEVQHDILQPEAYLFTVSRTEWMAPEFLDEALEIMKKQELKEGRERAEELRKRRSTTGRTDTRRSANRRTSPSRGERRGNTRRRPGGGRENMNRPPQPLTAVKERDAEGVRTDFEKELLNDKSVVGIMQDSLLVWAHDDTAEPGKVYQYRIRIGVFNPIAGKNWLPDTQVDYKNQLVLWSDYSEPTVEVSVPKRIYVFPMGIIADKDAGNDIKGVQVEVAKYYLGRWRDFDFDVYPGEVIGHEVEDVAGGYQMMMTEAAMEQDPEQVDFASDATLVDVIREIDWTSRLRPGTSYKMLYYDAEKRMQQVAVGKNSWRSDTRVIYNEIQDSIARGVEQRTPGMTPDGMPPDMMMDPMMMDQMMMEFQ